MVSKVQTIFTHKTAKSIFNEWLMTANDNLC